jgi:hypothetical protein
MVAHLRRRLRGRGSIGEAHQAGGRRVAYHTSEPEDPAVYHTNDDCPAGKQIKPGNRVEGTGTGRRKCEEC